MNWFGIMFTFCVPLLLIALAWWLEISEQRGRHKSIAHFAMIDAAKSHDPNRGAYSTFVVRITRSRLLSEMENRNTRKRKHTDVPLEEWRDAGYAGDTDTSLDVRATLESALRGVKEQEKNCFTLHYIDGYTYREIGEMYGFSFEWARHCADKVVNRFKMLWELAHRREGA